MMRTLQSATSRIYLILLFILCFSVSQAAPDPAKGKELFKANCTACHKVDQDVVGPALKGVLDRWKGREKLLHDFIHNPNSVVAKDAYAANLKKRMNNAEMTPQTLTDAEIDDVLSYVNVGDGGGGPDKKDAIAKEEFKDIPADGSWMRFIVYGIIILLGIALFMARRLTKSNARNEMYKPSKWLQTLNAVLFPVFLVVWFALFYYEWTIHSGAKYQLPESASDTGRAIDELFLITAYVTFFVFIVTHLVLFAYPFMYRQKEGQKAYFYSHNNKLEFIWTSIPAVVLAVLVLYGFKTWQKATGKPEKNAEDIELFARQFDWTFRYAGPDGKLGKVNFRLMTAENPLGLDFTDPAAKDDILTKELHFPVNRQVYLKLRSRDVIHGAYLPHFRAQMYAQPGMDNRIHFIPEITTEDMRFRLKNPNFNYELACNQLCGASHFNMRNLIVVESEADFQKWKLTFKSAYELMPKPTASISK